MGKPVGQRSRKRGRPFKLPYLERERWVGLANEARRLSLPLARLQQLSASQQESFAKLPADLQLVVVLFSSGRHSRHLNAAALELLSPPPQLNRLLRKYAGKLIPKGDRSKWSAADQRGFELLKQLRRATFGKNVDVDAHLVLELIHIDQPAYVGGAPGAIDRWIADHLKVSASTLRAWRRQSPGDPMIAPPAGRTTPRRRSGRDLQTRLAHRAAR